MTVSTTVPTAATLRRPRRIVLGALAALYAAFTALASFGLPSLLTAWTTSGEELPLRTQYVVWGVLAGLLIPLTVLPLVRRPRVAQAQQLGVLVLACILGLALALEPENAEYAAYIAVPAAILLALHPAVRDVFSTGTWHRPTLAVAVLAAAPAFAYAVTNARESAATSAADPAHGQYLQAAVLALTLLGSTFVAARRAAGWRWVAAGTIVGAALLGLAGVLFPDDLSSPGTVGGAATLLLALGLVVTSLRTQAGR
jgi:hypothetical protein